MSSTELFDAASISMTSSEVALAIATHDSHTPQGSTVGPFTQLRQAARILAIDVSPAPARRRARARAPIPPGPRRPEEARAAQQARARAPAPARVRTAPARARV